MDLNSEFCGVCVIKETKKCEQWKHKAKCKDCKGSGICEHGIQKYYCHDCKGGGICIHDKYKKYCKECGGSAFCEHEKLKKIVLFVVNLLFASIIKRRHHVENVKVQHFVFMINIKECV